MFIRFVIYYTIKTSNYGIVFKSCINCAILFGVILKKQLVNSNYFYSSGGIAQLNVFFSKYVFYAVFVLLQSKKIASFTCGVKEAILLFAILIVK